MPRWVIESLLARCYRPGFDDPGPGERVGVGDVDRWLEQVAELGVRSILCILRVRNSIGSRASLAGYSPTTAPPASRQR